MIHSIHLDEEYVAVKKSSKKMPLHTQNVRFENNIAPEGYSTSKEFRKRAVEIVNTFCDRHGIL
jgi:hypothetical protein